MTETKSFIDSMSSKVNVGMDEVVYAFVAKYEDRLFEKKGVLQKRLKKTKQELTDLTNRLRSSIDTSQYERTIPVLDLTSRVERVEVVWESGCYDGPNFKPAIRVNINIEDNVAGRRPARLKKVVEFPISTNDVNRHKELNEKVSDLSAELTEVLTLIKTVSRKERQVRGRIAEMKLKDSGYEGLLNSPDLLALVQLDD